MKKEYDFKKLKKREGPVKVDEDAARVPVSLRIDSGTLSDIKSEAKKKGIPYQTLINSILFQYANGSLIEEQTVEILQKLKAS